MTKYSISVENFIRLVENKDRNLVNLVNKNGNHQAKYKI